MSEEKETTATHVEDGAANEPAVLATSSLAARFEHRQHTLTRTESIKENVWPLVWCLYMFFLCITWGFDGLAGGIVVSITEFRRDFGTPYGDDYVVSATWQLGFQAATIFAMTLGAFVAGFAINRYGRQPVVLAAFVLSIAGTFLQFFSKNLAEFVGGKILTGLPLGVFTTAAPPYASEMAPLTIRGSVAAGMNFSIVLGQLIGYGVMREASHYGDARAYKVLFATQWGFAAVALVFLPFFPESPYWLVAHGRAEKARKNLERLHDSTYDYDGHMAEIHESLARQNQDNDSQGSYLECFSKAARKRTLVAIGMFFIQNASGPGWVVGYMSYYFQLAGMAPAASFDTTVGLAGLMAIGNIVGWFFVDYFGRRGTALYGSIILTITLFLIGASSLVKTQGAVWAQVVFMAIWSFSYQGTLGAVAWPIATEAATSRLRAPTQALAITANGLSSSIWTLSLPYAINPDQGNLGGKVAFIFGATLAVCCVFIFFMVPETKDRTYIEIDELWTRKVPPRKFKSTNLVTLPNDK
ncbi:Solute carrier family 2 facilitated glucose transporter member 5 [Colletotrichum gloeosporioides]|uniref:MFS hexose transporter n=2 Tax=Colletotrichum gloeosporioides TaxID=474922 RepID=T0LUY6_COLGC|nr:Solute carrier family 2 facilitated glucose transporter member 5 [Colletotrichum gloeosporioides]EQB55591.1 MFS hexose transporter [Colletotrichum gloeosporioides Cg-14]KAF3805711.1 Solute carrier family 2 facilitated glucose transporter member 5 [Colletotrichum gloeosporioides]